MHLILRFQCDRNDWDGQSWHTCTEHNETLRISTVRNIKNEAINTFLRKIIFCFLTFSFLKKNTHSFKDVKSRNRNAVTYESFNGFASRSFSLQCSSYLQYVLALAGSPNSLVAKLFLSLKYEKSPQHMNETWFTSLHTSL